MAAVDSAWKWAKADYYAAPSPSPSSDAAHLPSIFFVPPVPPRRTPNKLRKPPPPPRPPVLSFIPDDPPPASNFPAYAPPEPAQPRRVPRPPPSAPSARSAASLSVASAASTASAASAASAASMPDLARRATVGTSRKLTKRRPSLPDAPAPPLPPLPPLPAFLAPPAPPPARHNSTPAPRRRTTLSFSLRRKTAPAPVAPVAFSDDGHGPPASPAPRPGLDLRASASESGHADAWLPALPALSPFAISPGHPPWPERQRVGSVGALPAFPAAPAAAAWASTWSVADDRPHRPRFTLGTDEDGDTDADADHSGRASPAPSSPASPRRPPLMRQNAALGLPRRWTLAMAMTDEGITDEALVAELERVRGAARGAPNTAPEAPEPASEAAPAPPAAVDWPAARRALLTVRELVRTERHYLVSLRTLHAGGTAPPPPPLMVSYVGALLDAGSALLALLEADPSARGAARAFLEGAPRLEGALAAWCGAVGAWFTGPQGGEPHPLRRTVSAWRRSMPSLPVLALAPAPRKPPVRDLAILPTQRVMRYVLLYRDLLAHTPPDAPSHALVAAAADAAVRIAQRCDRAQGNAAFLRP